MIWDDTKQLMYHLNSAFPSNHLDGYKILYNFRSRSLSLQQQMLLKLLLHLRGFQSLGKISPAAPWENVRHRDFSQTSFVALDNRLLQDSDWRLGYCSLNFAELYFQNFKLQQVLEFNFSCFASFGPRLSAQCRHAWKVSSIQCWPVAASKSHQR